MNEVVGMIDMVRKMTEERRKDEREFIERLGNPQLVSIENGDGVGEKIGFWHIEDGSVITMRAFGERPWRFTTMQIYPAELMENLQKVRDRDPVVVEGADE